MQKARNQCTHLEDRLAVADKVNRQVLSLKSDTEYKLMEALARMPSQHDQQQQHPRHPTPVATLSDTIAHESRECKAGSSSDLTFTHPG